MEIINTDTRPHIAPRVSSGGNFNPPLVPEDDDHVTHSGLPLMQPARTGLIITSMPVENSRFYWVAKTTPLLPRMDNSRNGAS